MTAFLRRVGIPRSQRGKTISTVAAILGASLILASSVFAQSQRIAAVVNDDIISGYDLESRIALVLATSNLPDRPEVRKKLHGEVLSRLIDEKLQMQEAKRLGVKISPSEVNQAIQSIARQNKLNMEKLKAVLAKTGADVAELEAQISAQSAWSKVIGRLIRSRVTISADEVKDRLAQIEAETGKPQFRIAEIFLPVETPKAEREVEQMAGRLYRQIGQGADFKALARSFSRGGTAAVGGDLGWVMPSQIENEIREHLEKMQPGNVTPPIRTLTGFYIVVLVDTRINPGLETGETILDLSQLVLPVPPGADEEAVFDVRNRLVAMAAAARNCGDLARLGTQAGSNLSGKLGKMPLSKLAGPIKRLVRGLGVNQVSAPLRTPAGLSVLMVCGRKLQGSGKDKNKVIREMLLRERLEMAARRHLRDLRRSAFIEKRL